MLKAFETWESHRPMHFELNKRLGSGIYMLKAFENHRPMHFELNERLGSGIYMLRSLEKHGKTISPCLLGLMSGR